MKVARGIKYLILLLALSGGFYYVLEIIVPGTYKGRALYRGAITEKSNVTLDFEAYDNKRYIMRIVLKSANDKVYYDLLNSRIIINNKYNITIERNNKRLYTEMINDSYKAYLRNPSGYGGKEIGYFIYSFAVPKHISKGSVKLNIRSLQVDNMIEKAFGPSILVVEEHAIK